MADDDLPEIAATVVVLDEPAEAGFRKSRLVSACRPLATRRVTSATLNEERVSDVFTPSTQPPTSRGRDLLGDG